MINCNKHIKDGRCKGDCCQIIPFPKKAYEKFQHKSTKIVTKIVEWEGNLLKSKKMLIGTKDKKCVFLTKEYKCNIYKNRPAVCKKFKKCPHE
jgi:Fe-S-cluster containining protein